MQNTKLYSEYGRNRATFLPCWGPAISCPGNSDLEPEEGWTGCENTLSRGPRVPSAPRLPLSPAPPSPISLQHPGCTAFPHHLQPVAKRGQRKGPFMVPHVLHHEPAPQNTRDSFFLRVLNVQVWQFEVLPEKIYSFLSPQSGSGTSPGKVKQLGLSPSFARSAILRSVDCGHMVAGLKAQEVTWNCILRHQIWSRQIRSPTMSLGCAL